MKKWILIPCALLLLVLVYLFCIHPVNLAGKGAYVLVETSISPDAEYAVDNYQYRGGATVVGFTFVSLRKKEAPANPDDFSARVASGNRLFNVKAAWNNNHHLVLTPEEEMLELLKPELNGVTIEISKENPRGME